MRYLLLILLMAGCLKSNNYEIKKTPPIFIQVEQVDENDNFEYSNIIYLK